MARISNAPTVVTNVLAGAAVAGVAWHADMLPVAVAMVLLYTGGMYLNDVCDLDHDRVERPERPLPSGIVRPKTAVVITATLFVIGSGLLATVSQAAFLSGLVLVALIVLYDAWHKGNPAGPALMGSMRALVYATSFFAFSSAINIAPLWVCAMALLYVIGLTAVARHETRPGIMDRWPAACLLFPSAWFAWTLPLGWSWILLAAFVVWVGHALVLVRRGIVGPAIARLIAGITMFDALVLLANGFHSGAITALGAFGLTLFLQRYVKGT